MGSNASSITQAARLSYPRAVVDDADVELTVRRDGDARRIDADDVIVRLALRAPTTVQEQCKENGSGREPRPEPLRIPIHVACEA